MDYNTFKKHMKQLIGEFDISPHDVAFNDWILIYMKIEEERWVPKENEEYWIPYILLDGTAEATNLCWYDHEIDQSRLKNGFVFRTKKEAIAAAEKMLAALKN